jgi:hypothetical protein
VLQFVTRDSGVGPIAPFPEDLQEEHKEVPPEPFKASKRTLCVTQEPFFESKDLLPRTDQGVNP